MNALPLEYAMAPSDAHVTVDDHATINAASDVTNRLMCASYREVLPTYVGLRVLLELKMPSQTIQSAEAFLTSADDCGRTGCPGVTARLAPSALGTALMGRRSWAEVNDR